MTYSTGSAANIETFVTALRDFALSKGWTIDRFDTSAKRLYLHKGVCYMAWGWADRVVPTYSGAGSSVVNYTDSYMFGLICSSFGTLSENNFHLFPGTNVSNASNAVRLIVSDLKSVSNYFFFSDADGNYIHAAMNTQGNRYNHFGFGNADKGTLTHSGASYAFCDGSRYFYRQSSTSSVVSVYYNQPSYTATLFTTSPSSYYSSTYNAACFMALSSDALPTSLGFVNNLSIPSDFSQSAYQVNAHYLMGIKRSAGGDGNNPVAEESYKSYTHLFSGMMLARNPDYSTYLPMAGLPLIVSNATNTAAVCIGSIPDVRLINLEGLTAQQEIEFSSDIYKCFPELAIDSWWNSGSPIERPSSGLYGIAYRKI